MKRAIYGINYVQNTMRDNKLKLSKNVMRYRLIITLCTFITIDHSLDSKIEDDLKRLTKMHANLEKLSTYYDFPLI